MFDDEGMSWDNVIIWRELSSNLHKRKEEVFFSLSTGNSHYNADILQLQTEYTHELHKYARWSNKHIYPCVCVCDAESRVNAAKQKECGRSEVLSSTNKYLVMTILEIF